MYPLHVQYGRDYTSCVASTVVFVDCYAKAMFCRRRQILFVIFVAAFCRCLLQPADADDAASSDWLDGSSFASLLFQAARNCGEMDRPQVSPFL